MFTQKHICAEEIRKHWIITSLFIQILHWAKYLFLCKVDLNLSITVCIKCEMD